MPILFTKERLPLLTVLLGILVLADGRVCAADAEAIEFGIVRHEGRLSAWLNLAPFLTSKRVDQLKQGIDLFIEYDIALKTPRKLWGARRIDGWNGAFKIGYRLITDDFFLSATAGKNDDEKFFVSLAKLHQHLADSILVRLADIAKLDQDRRYFLEIGLTLVTLTSFNLATEEGDQGRSESAIRFLFRQFLRVTSYGRQDYTVKSRLFSLAEILDRE